MNMLTFDKTEIQNKEQPFIADAVFAVEAINSNQVIEKQVKAKQFLDKIFPLESGSHEAVTSYVIDYHHVMAYFKDGCHSGLKFPKQFIAYEGEKEDPRSLLLRDGVGSHVEISFGRHKGTGCIELVEINDIQLETCTTLSRDALHTSGVRHWLSLLKGDGKGLSNACNEEKEYTAKSGEDYQLERCYTVK